MSTAAVLTRIMRDHLKLDAHCLRCPALWLRLLVVEQFWEIGKISDEEGARCRKRAHFVEFKFTKTKLTKLPAMDNSTLLFDIPASCSRKINARFDGGDLNSDAGLLLVAQADERIGLTARMASALSEKRQKGKIRFDLLTLLRERIYAIAAGY